MLFLPPGAILKAQTTTAAVLDLKVTSGQPSPVEVYRGQPGVSAADLGLPTETVLGRQLRVRAFNSSASIPQNLALTSVFNGVTINEVNVTIPALGQYICDEFGDRVLDRYGNIQATGGQVSDGTMTGQQAANVPNANAVAGIEVVHRIDLADAADATVTPLVLTYKFRITDIVIRKNTTAGDSNDKVTVKNGSNLITEAKVIGGTANALMRPATLISTYEEIAAGGTVNFLQNKTAGNNGCTVYLKGVRVA